MEEVKDFNKTIVKTYRKTIWKKAINAVDQYQMIKANDKIGVCISGGKDSFLLALVLREIRRHHKTKFDLQYLVMDPGYDEKTIKQITMNAKLFDLDLHIFKTDIFKAVEKESKPCYICARKRRGHLYNEARKLGCNKIALGHHFDDVIETILLNILYTGSFGSMLPKLKSKHYPGMELIRPLYLVKEEDILRWVKYHNLTFSGCACQVANKKTDSKRRAMKELISNLKAAYPDVDKNIFKSSENVNLNTILGYLDNENHSFLDKY